MPSQPGSHFNHNVICSLAIMFAWWLFTAYDRTTCYAPLQLAAAPQSFFYSVAPAHVAYALPVLKRKLESLHLQYCLYHPGFRVALLPLLQTFQVIHSILFRHWFMHRSVDNVWPIFWDGEYIVTSPFPQVWYKPLISITPVLFGPCYSGL